MGASKNLLMLMQEQEVESNNFLLTKKEIELSSKSFAKNLIDSGEIDKLEAFAQAERLTTAISNVRDELKASLPREKQNAYGIEINPVNGRQIFQFSDDPIWQQLNADLKAREELLKLALKQDVIDAYGENVPKVSVKYASDSLAVKY
jgi:hypothetical protein